MSQLFDLNTTRRQQILVEYLTATGSAFAVTPQGEQVFMNKRLVDTMGVLAGDIYNAFLLPNYPDKQASIPWRAMRVEPSDVSVDISPVVADSIPNRIADYMEEIDEDGFYGAWLPIDIAEAMNLDVTHVEEALAGNPELFDPVQSYMLRFKDK